MVSQFKLNYVPNLDDLALIGKALDRRREQQGPNQQLAEYSGSLNPL
jgi:hypothetical protein